MISFLNEFTPAMASYRYRTLMPANEIGADINNPDADVLVISKPTHVGEIRKYKEQGKKIVADFCDDHFEHPSLGEIYHRIAKLADYCVCPTEAMRKRVPHSNVAVIPDPYEMEEVEPHATGDKLLWFGHNAGVKAIHWLMPYLPNLTVVTGPQVEPGMVLYSPESLREEMLKANIAVFPTAKGHEYKSPNRLINALRMGLFPVCDPHPSYDEFSKFVWTTEVPTGVKWAREFNHELNDFVREGQHYIRDRYSVKTIGLLWKDLLEGL